MRELTAARTASAALRWAEARDAFRAADAACTLEAGDLDLFAVALFMLGDLDGYFAMREREYEARVQVGDDREAARTAVWIGVQRMIGGEVGAGTGWLGRAARHIERDGAESAALALFLAAGTFALIAEGKVEEAVAQAGHAVEVARHDGDVGIATLALHQQGLLCINAGQSARGLALLDEAMLNVTGDAVPPMIAGIVYCGVIEGCWIVYDLRRAREWTGALSRWRDGQSELVTFTGECKVHRAQLLELRGSWADAAAELVQIRTDGAQRGAAAMAAYARGNLARLQGQWDAAEDEYRLAAELGYEPQPGLAQLRLATGSTAAAAAMTRRALAEQADGGRRIELLAAATQIMLAVADLAGAQAAADELASIGRLYDSPVVTALGDMARAAVALGAAQPEAAARAARPALETWLHIDAPYQQALTRELLASACEALGDAESASRERDSARAVFVELGARPDLARLDGAGATARDVLTPRELDVLRLIAGGATNRVIAEQLVLSERTVDRHVSNIFGKLGISSRSAATAYAYERHLV